MIVDGCEALRATKSLHDIAGDGERIVRSFDSELQSLSDQAEVCRQGHWIAVGPNDSPSGLSQGWKLHVAAYPSNAHLVLRAALPVLLSEKAHFKVVGSREELGTLNIGAVGASQVGKFMTVYPTNDRHAVRLAEQLHEATRGLVGPAVPSDRRLCPGSLVHYRYGAFGPSLVQLRDGTVAPAIRSPEGDLVADERLPYFSPPVWATNPFPVDCTTEGGAVGLASRTSIGRYYVVAVLSHTIRGSVFLGLDVASCRTCVVKSAHKTPLPDGGDSADILRREAAVLERLGGHSGFPTLYEVLEHEEECFLVMEDIPGQTLSEHISAAAVTGRLGTDAAIARMGLNLIRLLEHVHGYGYVYRDLKSSNVLVSGEGALSLVDFECVTEPGHAWGSRGTIGYMSPQQRANERASFEDDIYGLGALLYFIATGAEPCRAPDVNDLFTRPPQVLNPSLSPELAGVLASALHPDAVRRPQLAVLAERLATLPDVATLPSPGRRTTRVPAASDEAERRQRCAEAARRLGDTLCDEAEPAPEGGSMWRSGATGTLPIAYRQINNGVPGVLLALAELWHAFRDYRHRETLYAGCEWLVESAPLPGASVAGLYAGEAGVGVALLRAGQVTAQTRLIVQAAACEERIRTYEHDSPDLFAGTAGRLRFLALLSRQTGDLRHLDHACQCADHLVATASSPQPDQAYWCLPDGYEDTSAMTEASYAHGTAGIADALLDLYEVTGDERLADVAVRGARWVRQRAVVTLPDDSGLDWGPAGAFSGLWCYGASGVGRLFLRLARLGLMENALETAERAGLTVARASRAASPVSCHGLAGSIEYLLDLFLATRNRSWLDEAWDLETLLQAFRFEEDGRLSWIADRADGHGNSGYMVGYAGVAMCLLRLSDPQRFPHQLSLENFSATGPSGDVLAAAPPFDPHTVEIEGRTGESKFQFSRKLILRFPAQMRVDTARILFARIRSETRNLWVAEEHASADGGTYWIGSGKPFIFALDPSGDAFEGFGPDIKTTTGDGTTRPNYGFLRRISDSKVRGS